MLRRQAKAYRISLDKDKKAEFDKKISNKLQNLWQYRESNVILIYMSSDIEVSTRTVIERALADGKRVFLPRCTDADNQLEFFEIKDFSSLEKRAFNLLEPIYDEGKKLRDFNEGLCVVPALLFDRRGYRIGYGKGYYDSFLSSFGGLTVGLCYDENLMDTVPYNDRDIKVRTVLTQSETVNTCEGRECFEQQ